MAIPTPATAAAAHTATLSRLCEDAEPPAALPALACASSSDGLGIAACSRVAVGPGWLCAKRRWSACEGTFDEIPAGRASVVSPSLRPDPGLPLAVGRGAGTVGTAVAREGPSIRRLSDDRPAIAGAALPVCPDGAPRSALSVPSMSAGPCTRFSRGPSSPRERALVG